MHHTSMLWQYLWYVRIMVWWYRFAYAYHIYLLIIFKIMVKTFKWHAFYYNVFLECFQVFCTWLSYLVHFCTIPYFPHFFQSLGSDALGVYPLVQAWILLLSLLVVSRYDSRMVVSGGVSFLVLSTFGLFRLGLWPYYDSWIVIDGQLRKV